MKKKKWARPQLIVITRGDRQEMVLLKCKTFSGGSGTGAFHPACLGADKDCCAGCSDVMDS
ncbi:MAG: hypothetical protein MUF05_04910 [Candidatus Omnitrophica bacterium]|jgi:hypothetical protein|nr:hypothetical protein [Candidatus Omnitrophota bacterium]